MHLGDILDILSDESGEVTLNQAMRMARNIMELHASALRTAKDESYNEGYTSGHEVGKSLVSVPTPDEWEVQKLRRVYDASMRLAREQVPGIVDRVGKHRKIQCIKELRNSTGLGLKDSKDIVDEYVNKLNDLYSPTYYGDEPPF